MSAPVPELPEVESYRLLAETALGRTVARVEIRDPRYLRGDLPARRLSALLRGTTFTAARRRGKLLILDIAAPDGAPSPHRLGLRFGMTGRLAVDGRMGVGDLLYSPVRTDPAWDRFALRFADGGRLVMHDPRLLGGVSLDPDEDALGPDATTITPRELSAALEGSAVALKARLLDQARVAGIGNLIADELLWRAALSPGRRAGSLTSDEVRRLHRQLRRTLTLLTDRGGSHTGDLMDFRQPGGRCPKDGAELRRSTVGGRTSWWCPHHQR